MAADPALGTESYIVEDDDVMGGTPVIRGTRITVYAVEGRLNGGESIEDILADYPYISRAAIEAAIDYARAHPFIERPGGRPWIGSR